MKKIYVVKPSLPPLDEYVNEIKDIWESGIMTHQGPKHQKLEAELKEYLQAPNIQLFGNGHLALELGLEAMHMEGEVITTPFTFGSTTQAILRNHLKPVFCDIRDDDYTLDAAKIESLITERTCAILPVHVYGNICENDKIQAIADRYGLKVIYDGAHAFGETWKGVNVANLGDATMFSFHATKVFNTVEGGCLVYKDGSMNEELMGLRQFGQIVHTEAVPYVGTNAKLTEMAAAMGLCNLPHLHEYLQKRRQVVERYMSALGGIEGLKLNKYNPEVESNYAYFPIVFEEAESGVTRDMAITALAAEGIYVRKYFYPLTSNFECVQELGIFSHVPIANHIANRVITLPCYSDLALEDVDRICEIIKALYGR